MFYKSDIIHRPLDTMSKVAHYRPFVGFVSQNLKSFYHSPYCRPYTPTHKTQSSPLYASADTVAAAAILIARYDTV